MPKIEKVNEWLFKMTYGIPKNPFDVVDVIEEKNENTLFKCFEMNEKLLIESKGIDLAEEIGSSAKDGYTSITFHSANGHFFGFGEKMGYVDKRGREMMMVNTDNPLHTPDLDPMYISIPFFILLSPKKPAIGFFINSTSYSFFKINDDTYTISVKDEGLEIYAIYGPKIDDVITHFTGMVGRMEMPPAWSIGYQQSRWSYSTDEEALDVARRMRKDSIPCDVLYLDIDYMDGYRVFTWGKNFPDPKKFVSEMKEIGFKVVTIVDPGVKIDENYAVYKSGKSIDAFVKDRYGKEFTGYVWPGKCSFPDFLRPDVREWWSTSHKVLFDAGVEGIWNDMNEPAIVWTDAQMDKVKNILGKGEINFQLLGEAKAVFAQEDHGDEIIHKDENGERWPHYKVRNIYAYLEAIATSRAFELYRPGKRPFLLTRAGFAGIQKYAAVWTGDNSSWWEHLEAEIAISIGLGLSGVSFTGTDVGGFGGNSNGELLARWTEMGVFFPFFRNHSAIGTVHQEPWAFGEKIEKIIKKYITLRYELFPHMYTAFHSAHENGVPIMRPLFFIDQDNPDLYSINDEFLFGDSLLIAPITKPNTMWRSVYIPKGRWIDMRNGKIYEEDHVYKIDAPLDEIPIFVKENSMIFRTDPMNYIFEKEKMTLYVDVYGQEGRGYLYEDDGETLEYKKGGYNLYEFAVGSDMKGYTLSFKAKHHGYAGRYEKITMNFINAPRKIANINLNGKKVNAYFDGNILKVEFEIKDAT
jgi:alpha-glucosidase